EGYPGRRYYGGCEVVDVVEDLAIARAKELFGAEHANVQPHSGAQANMAVYFTLLKPGDTVLGPNLSHGGHLTAGSPVNYSGKFYSIVADGDQDAARSARRDGAVRRRPRAGARQDGHARRAGWPAHARDRGQGGGLPRGADARVARLSAADREEREGAGRSTARPRLPAGERRHRHAPAARRPVLARDHRQGRAGGARPRLDHGEQEHDSVRDQEPHGDERRSARYARRHDARDERV